MAKRRMPKEAYEFVINTIHENGSMSTDSVVELVRAHYEFDHNVAHERELRRYVGQLMSRHRSGDGTRTLFLDRQSSVIVDIETCNSLDNVAAVNEQLRSQAIGIIKSYKKAEKRVKVLEGQISFFDESGFWNDLKQRSGAYTA